MDVNPPGPDQAYITPGVVELAETVELTTKQVRVAPALALAFGVEMSCVTVAVAVLVQPFAGLVTVSR